MSIRLRAVEPSDRDFLWDMQYEALYVPPGAKPYPRSVLDEPGIAHYIVDFGDLAGDVGFVAEDAGQRVGAAWGRRLPADDPGYGWVDEHTPELGIAVVADRRGEGIGSKLLAALLELAPRMSLSVDDRNPATALYARFGFEPVATDGHSVTMLRQA